MGRCGHDDRWFILAFCLLLESVGGLFYLVGVYSDVLKVRFSLTQSQVLAAALAGNIGGNFGFPAGILFDKWGPAPVLVLGAISSAVGWSLLWLLFFAPPADVDLVFLQLVVASYFQGQGQCWTDVVSVSALSQLFPESRGKAIGAAKSFVGLSGAIFSQLYITLFKPHISGFAAFSAILLPAVSLVSILFIPRDLVSVASTACNGVCEGQTSTDKRMIKVSLGILSLAGILFASTLQEDTGGGGGGASDEVWMWNALWTLAVLLVFLGVLFYTGALRDRDRGVLSGGVAAVGAQAADPLVLEDLGPVGSLLTLNFWLLFAGLFIVMGSGLVFINNIGQMVVAYGGKSEDATAFVSLISIFNCCGRLAIGNLSDWAVLKKRVPRPFCLVLPVSLLAIANLALEVRPSILTLYASSAVAGAAYGGCFSLLAAMPAELFGLRSVGMMYASLSVCTLLGSTFIATWLVSAIYQEHVPAGSTTCIGAVCFSMTLRICASGCLVTVLCSMLVGIRSRGRYKLLFPAAPHVTNGLSSTSVPRA